MKNVKDLNVTGKVVIVRCDFNVPQKGGVISDDNRIVAALPTIKELIAKDAKIVLMSHLGKVDYKIKDKATGTKRDATPEEIEAAKKKNNLECIVARLSELLGQPVRFCPATRGEELKAAVAALNNGDVLVMQNTRYEKGESKNDEALSQEWASLADAFVMDAFGSAHRAHASTVGIPSILKAEGKQVAVGYLVEKEVVALKKAVEVEERPYIAILGGAKVSSKIAVINALVGICDKIIIGGAMSYTFFKALGKTVGNSLVEDDQIEYAKEMMATGKLLLPVDSVVADSFDNPQEVRTINVMDEDCAGIPDGFEGMDIGPRTAEIYAKEIATAKTIFWNGPMGVFELDQFATGTIAVCKACAELKDAFTIIGGGDSASAAKKLGYKEQFSHVSTGGGASLEMIENHGHLPGIDVIGD